MQHKPVLLKETLECLNLKPGSIVVDGTLGSGGHALEILKAIGPGGLLIGLDQDPEAIERCQNRILKDYPQKKLVNENFSRLDRVLDDLNVPAVDAVILDIGISSDQLSDPMRGFSFDLKGPLDMRMNPATIHKASDLINDLSETDLEKLFRENGEYRFAKRFAESICDQREKNPIQTTEDLVNVIDAALPRSMRFEKGHRPSWARRHPATRVFQALRIAVNNELGVLSEVLPIAWSRIKPEGRFAIISFHSNEDRTVKGFFRELRRTHQAVAVTKKPIMASRPEMLDNPRSRSAKLRAVIKSGEGRAS